MPVNRNALIRYKTIDACLRRRNRKWTLEDLEEACSDALYEYEGIRKGVSRRSIQLDLQMMRSEKLGYNAPIIVVDKKYYTYEDPDYSIANIPLTQQDLGTLNEVVTILRQFKGFTHFREVDDMVNRLQHKIQMGKTQQRALIDFEKNELLQGLEHLEGLYAAVVAKRALTMTYQSFRSKNNQVFTLHPHFLKEFRNRWFVIGLRDEQEKPQIFALDRVQTFESNDQIPFRWDQNLDAGWLKDTIGVSKTSGQQRMLVKFRVSKDQAPYVMTKPFHHSQHLLEQAEDGSAIFTIEVVHNLELEREFLGFGQDLEILEPRLLRKRIRNRLEWAWALYQDKPIIQQDSPSS
ncbi:helix-turn-helix transcriptional regulator [Haliscomenobacter sp.]|uniref:helix-turn-helix transcriptional regulator n=1 Tax=Haliscomenobacter sp. TaxID=2717303 RepID=UPI003592F821